MTTQIAQRKGRVYVVANSKGGAGKTTTAINMVIARALAGMTVALINGDAQRTANIAMGNRAAAGIEPTISCMHYPNGPELRAQVAHQSKIYDEIWIDCGGQDSPAMRAAFMLADVILIPFQPRSFDVWAMEDVSKLIVEARSMRDGLRVYAFLNQADAGDKATDNIEAAEYVASLDPQAEIVFLDAPLRRRKSFSNAGGYGLSVLEPMPKDMKKPLDKKAIDELNALISAVIGAGGMVQPDPALPISDDVDAPALQPVAIVEA